MSHGFRRGYNARGFVAIIWIAFGFARPARAQTTLEPVDLSYRAPEVCPSFSQFLAEVQRSTTRLRLGRVGESARHFEVVVEANGRAGHLTLDGGSKGERDVNGVDCAEVAGLLAFATALAADPDAQPPDPSSGVASFPTPGPAPTPLALKPPPVVAVVEPPRPVCATERAPRARRRSKWSVADLAFASGAIGPPVTWGGGVFGELELSAVTLAPRFRIGAAYAYKSIAVTPGSVTLTNELITLETCSGVLQRSTLTFLPCLRAEGGVRIAAGHQVPDARSQQRPVLDLGVAVHVRWRFAGPAFLELGGAMLFPTVQDDVVIQQGASTSNVSSVYEVPTLGALGEFALGVEFGDQSPD